MVVGKKTVSSDASRFSLCRGSSGDVGHRAARWLVELYRDSRQAVVLILDGDGFYMRCSLAMMVTCI